MTPVNDPLKAEYRDPKVVEFYAKVEGLMPSEEALFDRYLRPDMAILDIGVGGGRTTPRVSKDAARYVGVDYSPEMVRAAQRNFPGLEFREMDVTSMSAFSDASFDAVLFPLNGLGCLPNDTSREMALREVARVVRPGGTFIFSLHNAAYLVFPTTFHDVGLAKKGWRLAYAAVQTVRIAATRLPSRFFWKGRGYSPGGVGVESEDVYLASPARVAEELDAASFDLRTILSGNHPREHSALMTPWYYYAAVRR